MPKIAIGKQKAFIALTALHILSACLVLINELLAINNRVPGGNFPIEHKYSWARVLLFCGIAIADALVIWIFTVKKDSSAFLPSLKLVLPVALLVTLLSVLSNYPSVSGWCCEVYPTQYFGFPFSYLSGDSLLDTLHVPQAGRTIRYHFPYIPYEFILDLLFWSSTVFIILSLISFLIQKRKADQEDKKNAIAERTSLMDRMLRLFLALFFGFIAGIIAFLVPARPLEALIPSATPPLPTATFLQIPTSVPTSSQRLRMLAFASTPALGLSPVNSLDPLTLPAKTSIQPTAVSAAQLIRILTSDDMPMSIAWSPDGAYVATVGTRNRDDGENGTVHSIRIWDWAQGQQSSVANIGVKHIASVAWSPDRKRVVSAEAMEVRESLNGELLAVMDTRGVICGEAGWSPNGNLLAGGCDDGSIFIWDASTGEQLRKLYGDEGSITGIAWSPNGQQIVSSSFDGTLRIWDVINGTHMNTVRHEESCSGASPCLISSIAWSPDGNQIAFSNGGPEILTWHLNIGLVRSLGRHWEPSSRIAIAWSLDGSKLASINGNSIHVWGLMNGLFSYEYDLDPGDLAATLGVAWSPDGKYLAVSGNSRSDLYRGFIWIWSIPETPKVVSSPTYPPQPTLTVTPSFTPTAQLPTATFTFMPEPTNMPTISPTNTGMPRRSKTRINLSPELYLDENSSPDNLRGEPYQGHHYFMNRGGTGFVYHFGNEEWVAAWTETQTLPSADFKGTPQPGDGLRQAYIQVWRDGKMLSSFPVHGICCQPKTLLRYEDHWIFWFMDDERSQGWIVQDGILLNDLRDYDSAFSPFLLDGKPFFFFKRGQLFGISFNNQEIILPYSNISYGPICCEDGGKGRLNPRGTDIMVGFYAQKGNSEYQYIEVGLR